MRQGECQAVSQIDPSMGCPHDVFIFTHYELISIVENGLEPNRLTLSNTQLSEK